MINYPTGNNGLYSNYQKQSPILGGGTPTYSGAMDFMPGITGNNALATDTVQMPGLNGLGTSSQGSATSNPTIAQIISVLVTLIQTLIQTLTQGSGQSSAMDAAPSQTPGIFAGNPSKKKDSTGDTAADAGNDANTGTGTAVNANDNEYLNFKQGQTGDCAVLSGIAAVSMDANGKKTLDDSVKANGDGSYTVKLKGTGETFNVSKDQMADDKLSKGEPKVRALENAVKQHYANKGDNFEGKGGPDVIKLLTGKETKSLNSDKDPAKLKQALIDLSKKDTNGLTLEVGAETLTGSETKGMHGYAVEKIDAANNTVTYENPWDAGKAITVSLDDFARDLTAKGSGGVDYALL